MLVKMLLMISKNLFCTSFRIEDCSYLVTDYLLSKKRNTNKNIDEHQLYAHN
jgi:hypothetical protein